MQSLCCPSCPSTSNAIVPPAPRAEAAEDAAFEAAMPQLALTGEVGEDARRFLAWALEVKSMDTATAAATAATPGPREGKAKAQGVGGYSGEWA